MEWGTELSPEVSGALPVVSAEVVRQLDRWTSAGGAALQEPQKRHRKQSSLENEYERNSSTKDHRFHVDFIGIGILTRGRGLRAFGYWC